MRRYRCTNCGWVGDTVAHCMATITGGKYAKDSVALSVCPSCCEVASTLKREIIPTWKDESKFYGHCRKCRHVNTCNLSTLPERGCTNYEEIK